MAAIPEADRQDETEATLAPPFAAPDAGADYFTTDAHYQALAGRIIARLRSGPGFVLVTGDPPPEPRHLAPALTKAAAGGYAVAVVTCGPELDREQLLRAAPPSEAPLFVFDGADSLSDPQLSGLCEASAGSDGVKPAAVLLTRPICITRLERLRPRLLRDGLATHFRLNELGPDEVETFIRRQVPAGEQSAAFTAEAIAAIADFSGGDPASVNRLSLLIAAFAQSARREANKPQDGAPEGEEAPQASLEALALEREPRRRHHRGAWMPAAFLLCLAIVGGALTPGHRIASLSDWLRPLDDLISHELTGKDLTSEPAPAPPSAMIAAVPPVAASAEPQPPAVAKVEAQPITPPAPAPVTPTEEPKPTAPAAEATEEPITPPAPAPVAPPLEPPAAMAAVATPPAMELPRPPPPSAAHTAALVARGDVLVSSRDIASARLYYERAAGLGDGRGALRMGETFDPVFLERAGIRGTRGDAQEALSWYRRARDLGDAEADRLLKNLEPRHP